MRQCAPLPHAAHLFASLAPLPGWRVGQARRA